MRDLPHNWLVFRLSALGDVVLTTGALRYWHEQFGWRFHVLTKDVFASVYDNNPVVDKVVGLSSADSRMPQLGRYFSSLASEYRGWGLLDLHGTLRSALLRAFWKGPVRKYSKYGLDRRLFLASRGVLGAKPLRAVNVPQRYAMAVTTPPPSADALIPAMYLTPEEKLWAKSFLANLFGHGVGKNAPGCVAAHPFASHAHKAWPMAHYEALLRELDARGLPWILIGRGETVLPGNGRDLISRTTMRESAALLAACSVLVTGDSGPMHLATAVNTPVVGLFGPTTREWGFYPSGPLDRVLEKDMPCRPCSLHGKKPCPRGAECLAEIRPEEVMAAVEDVLSGRDRSLLV